VDARAGGSITVNGIWRQFLGFGCLLSAIPFNRYYNIPEEIAYSFNCFLPPEFFLVMWCKVKLSSNLIEFKRFIRTKSQEYFLFSWLPDYNIPVLPVAGFPGYRCVVKKRDGYLIF
jgi:hypothetical protein